MACHLHALLGPRTEVRNLVRTQEPEFQKRDIDEQFRGKKNVVLYFYPRASTPGCTVQACGIRDYQKEFAALNTVVLAVSPDSVKKLKGFEDIN